MKLSAAVAARDPRFGVVNRPGVILRQTKISDIAFWLAHQKYSEDEDPALSSFATELTFADRGSRLSHT